MKLPLYAAALAIGASGAFAETQTYTIDPTHAQATFVYEHLGFSKTKWIISGFEGVLVLDRDDLASSTVTASVPIENLFSGEKTRDDHILRSGEFFKIAEFPDVTFQSTSVEVTGDTTALVTGDLTINGVTKSIVLDTVFNGETEEYPVPPFNGKPAVGFSATGSILRSDFNVGLFAPYIADEVAISLSFEAMDLN